MDEKILKILRLRSEEFISAEQLSRRVSIAPATVSRHIHKLRSEGYDIQTQPHLGYKLIAAPDKMLASEIAWKLNTKVIGRKIISYDTVDSTNTAAFTLAEKGAPEGTTVFAEGQKKGRGRLGRSWVSPKSKGIYLSLVLRPNITVQETAFITLLAAVSCAEGIRRACGLQALIRWPNDILVNNKKVCGILTEINAQNHTVKFVILGIGINVNTAKDKLPPGASSLKEESRDKKTHLSRIELAQELLRQLDREYIHFRERGSARIIAQWRNCSALSGKRVKINLIYKNIEGQALDIDQQGALIVRLDNGFRQHLMAGDVVKIR